MDEDRDDSQSLTSSVVREETNATDRHDHGTFSQADDIEKQLVTFLKKLSQLLKPEL